MENHGLDGADEDLKVQEHGHLLNVVDVELELSGMEAGDVRVAYSLNGGDHWAALKARAPEDATFAWRVPDSVPGEFLVKVATAAGVR